MRPVPRTIMTQRRPASPPPPQQRGLLRAWLAIALVIGILIFAFHLGRKHIGITIPGEDVASANAIDSGYTGNCLDVYHDQTKNGTSIDASNCNDSAAQDWATTATTISLLHTKSCVSATASGLVALSACSSQPGQVWVRVQHGYYNPNSGECLDEPQTGVQLKLGSCNNMSSDSVVWNPAPAAAEAPCGGNESEGQTIACNAVKEFANWQMANSNHEALLTTYTDGTPYEEWCADFVSYVYKESGYPFTNGSANGWDENNANNVQNLTFANQAGFTTHQAGSGYVPQPGDVAFFDYPGGHVEIVVSGGANPTFVYGDSAQIDPATGNGQMKSNTILSESDGQVMYYLTPSS
jgi:hypothetical protein